MSLATNVSNLATAVATELKSHKTLINGNATDLSSLTTTTKTNLVAAVNEVASSVSSAAGINDTTPSTSSTYSSTKTDSQIAAASTNDRARANHTGTQSADTLTDGTTNKAYTATEKTKLSGIATGATANSADATLLARASHTGTQAASTITGLATVATSGSYTDLSSKPTIPATYSDLTGTVPQSALPAVALTEFLGSVSSQSAMLALTGQRGDWCYRSDLGDDWQLVAEPASSLSSWQEHHYPTSPVSSVNGRTGAVTGLAEASDLTALTTAVGTTTTDFAAVFAAGLV